MILYRITIKEKSQTLIFYFRHTHLLFMGSVPHINYILAIVPY